MHVTIESDDPVVIEYAIRDHMECANGIPATISASDGRFVFNVASSEKTALRKVTRRVE